MMCEPIPVSSEIIYYAFLHALGRMTNAVKDVALTIEYNIDNIMENDLIRMVERIDAAEKDNNLGMDCDREVWLELRRKIKKQLEC